MANKVCYVVNVPPTREQGSYKTFFCGRRTDVRSTALWEYNKARAHDGLPPVKRLPRGTKVSATREWRVRR